jgi:hypothetical protein
MAKSTPIEPKSKADFDKAISDFAKEVKVEVSIITNEQMRLMLRDAMIFTPPMPNGGGQGLSVAAWKAGKNKLGNDVRRIFIPQDQPRKGMPVLLRQVINMVKGNDRQGYLALSQTINQERIKGMSPVMRKILDDTDWERSFKKAKNYLSKANIFGNVGAVAGMTSDLQGIHDNYKGKVGGRWPKGARLGGPQYMVGTALQLESYIAMRQLKVGRVKAAWATALRMIPPLISSNGSARNYGAYDAPWVDANRSAMGQFSMNQTADSISMTATNLIGNINNVASDAGTENIVYGNRVKQIQATVAARTKDKAERANRRK